MPQRLTATGSEYSVTVELYSIVNGMFNAGAGPGCLPDAPIPGTQCTAIVGLVQPGGTGGDVVICEPNGGLPTGITLPTGDQGTSPGTCGVDFAITCISHNAGAGFSISDAIRTIGGPELDDENGGTALLYLEDCSEVTTDPTGTWSFGNFSGVSDFRNANVCTVR